MRKQSRRDILILGAAATAGTAISPSAGQAASDDADLMRAYRRWEAAHADWEVAIDRHCEMEAAIFDASRARFGPGVDSDHERALEASRWCEEEKVRTGFGVVQAEVDRLLDAEDEALLAFYTTPADTLAGVMLKVKVADNLGDRDEALDGIIADLARMAGRTVS